MHSTPTDGDPRARLSRRASSNERTAVAMNEATARLPLFHLTKLLSPRLSSANPLDQFVFVIEGEKPVRTVAEMMKRGLPFLKLSPRMVRFITSDVDRWFAKHRVEGAR